MTNLVAKALTPIRLLSRQPAVAALVVVCLSLGIGLNTVILSVVDTLLFRSLPHPYADRLVLLFSVARGATGEPEQYNASAAEFLAWEARNSVFDRVVAMKSMHRTLRSAEPQRVSVAAVSDGFFAILGGEAVAGRTFHPEEDRPGAPLVAVVSHDFWQRQCARREVGFSLTLDDQTYTVVGVLAPGFQFLREADVWVPLAISEAHQQEPPTTRYLFTAARMKRGVSLEQATAQMAVLALRLVEELPESNAQWSAEAVALREHLVGEQRMGLLGLLVAGSLLLVIACLNVGSILLIRAVRRRDEFAIRSALGANRGRLVRSILGESLVLAAVGACLGIAAAALGLPMLRQISPRSLTPLPEPHLDARVLACAVGIALVSGLLPALPAALSSLRYQTASRLRVGALRGTEGVQGRRAQSTLVVTEVAMALVLLICAALALQSLRKTFQAPLGFRPEQVLMAQISLPEWKYSEPEQIVTFWRELLAEIDVLPGVLAASTTNALPVDDFVTSTVVTIEGRVPPSPDEQIVTNARKVSSQFFATLQIPIVAGRSFADSDDAKGPPVAIVSREMARRFWPGDSPVGRRLRRGTSPERPWLTIVGVAGDVYDEAIGTGFGSTLYIPHAQSPRSANPTVHLLVRTHSEPASVAGSVRHALRKVDRDQPLDAVSTMEDWVATSISSRRYATVLLSVLAGVGALLAVMGIYGVLSYLVGQRRQELGVRIAVGARAEDVRRLVLRQGLSLTAVGVALGVGIAVCVTRLFTSILYETEPTDAVTFIEISLLVMAIGALASWLPARRAALLSATLRSS